MTGGKAAWSQMVPEKAGLERAERADWGDLLLKNHMARGESLKGKPPTQEESKRDHQKNRESAALGEMERRDRRPRRNREESPERKPQRKMQKDGSEVERSAGAWSFKSVHRGKMATCKKGKRKATGYHREMIQSQKGPIGGGA